MYLTLLSYGNMNIHFILKSISICFLHGQHYVNLTSCTRTNEIPASMGKSTLMESFLKRSKGKAL